MSRLIVRRRARRGPRRLGTTLLGLTVGATAGFILAELVGPLASRFVREDAPGRLPSMAELVHDAQTALDDDPELSSLSLEVLPVSRQKVELHGWVADRRVRTRAHRLVRSAIGDDRVISRILVYGEDDSSSPTLDVISA
jgi:hypothetical protein